MKVFDAAKIRFFVGISKFWANSLVFCYQKIKKWTNNNPTYRPFYYLCRAKPSMM